MSNDKKIINIKATASTSNQKEKCFVRNIARAVIYTRTEAGQTDDYLSQIRKCDVYIKSKGWALSDIFQDEGKNGVVEKPELSLMMMKAAKYSFDIIVVSDLDRISRSQKEIAEINKILIDFHVALRSACESENALLGSVESLSV